MELGRQVRAVCWSQSQHRQAVEEDHQRPIDRSGLPQWCVAWRDEVTVGPVRRRRASIASGPERFDAAIFAIEFRSAFARAVGG
jgi:hypothetical protein